MRVTMKRLLLSIVAGTLVQFGIYLLAVIVNFPPLAGLLLLPGWILGFAGKDSDHTWTSNIISWLIMLAVNNLFYGPAIYFLLWRREVQKEKNFVV